MLCLIRSRHCRPAALRFRQSGSKGLAHTAAQLLPQSADPSVCSGKTARAGCQPSLGASADCGTHRNCRSRLARLMTSASASQAAEDTGITTDPVVQYVVLRSDLWQELKWPLGSIAAQACHAAVAAIWLTRDHQHTQQYCSPDQLDHMHKVVLEIKNETKLRELAAKLAQSEVPHKLWMEQPENVATCLALTPLPKSQAHPHVKRLKLCKGS